MNIPLAVALEHAANYGEWRAAARKLIAKDVAPDNVTFVTPTDSLDLFGAIAHSDLTAGPGCSGKQDVERMPKPTRHIRVPREFPSLAKLLICHSDAARFALLYRLLWRVLEEPRLLQNASDSDVWLAQRMAKSVRRDMHKMKAFVRFRKVEDERGEAFVAWFEPEHHIVERTAPFFQRRFTGMRWSIVTPRISAHWDGDALTFSTGATRADVPNHDALENHWRIYYASIFNPARLKVNAMRAEMPIKYWKNLPESRLIPELTRSGHRAQRAAPAGKKPSRATARQLVAQQPVTHMNESVLPDTLQAVAQQMQRCTRCSIGQQATMAVAGEGSASARLMIVGEQPGDQEDLRGRLFVGPAGEVLNRALKEAGVDRKSVYLTNAVKHFKYKIRGKRRIHQRPDASEIEHCRWWLDKERELISPAVILALGATAARAVLGHPVNVTKVRGETLFNEAGEQVIVTVHPAYLLRLSQSDEAQLRREQFVEDIKLAHALAG